MEPTEITRSTAIEFCREILPAVSRTFSISIRLLPGELGAAIRCAYLICRIADTIEDERTFSADEKAALFDALTVVLSKPVVLSDESSRPAVVSEATDPSPYRDPLQQLVESGSRLTSNPADRRLVESARLVVVAYHDLPEVTRGHVRRWTTEMIVGMRKFVLAYPHGVRIQSLDEYKEYCYYVAGTVGYLVTDLWHEHSPSIGKRRYAMLRERCQGFAEALQTVNILKDVAKDAEQENSIYIPEQLLRAHGGAHATIFAPERANATRAALSTLIQLAWRDLEQAKAYVLTIPRRAVAIRLSCALPLLFAYATLRDLTRLVEHPVRDGVVKISRAEVKSLTILSIAGVLSNRAMSSLVERARRKPVVVF
jgi:farnesyl-diphosphate farnesyltransferase